MHYVQSIGFSYFAFKQEPLFKVVTTVSELEVMMNQLRAAKTVAHDYETNGTAWWRGKRPCGIAFTTQNTGDPYPMSWYVPFRHITGQPQLPTDKVIAAQKEILENPSTLKISHNRKFELHMARVDGLEIKGPAVDTMIECRLYNEDAPAGLKERLIIDLNDPDAQAHEDMLKMDVHRLAHWRGLGIEAYMDQFGYAEMEIFLAGAYAGRDTRGCWDLHQLYEKLNVRSYYSRSPRGEQYRGIYDIEMALVDVLARMEHVGQPLDTEYLKKLHAFLMQEKDKAQLAFFQAFANKCEYFNLSSDDELRLFLQKGLKLKWDKLTETGKLAVDYDVISNLMKQVPALEHLLRYQEVEKKLSTYTLKLVDRADEHGILHADFQQLGTNTGRLSCKKPNLQNVSSDDPDRAKGSPDKIDSESIKRAFVVQRRVDDPWILSFSSGQKMFRLFGDYSQVELRVLAEYTQDSRLLQAYREGKDIHDEVERAVFGTGTEIVNGEKKDGPNRRKAKVINFGLAYGMGPAGFCRQVEGVSQEDAEKYFNEFNAKFPGVIRFKQQFWGYVRMNRCQFDSKFGRTRHVPTIVSSDNYEKRRGERMAFSTLIQGTAAEMTKQSLVLLDEFLRERALASRISQTIHDEIQIDGPVEEFAEVARAMKQIMQDYPDFSIPIVADLKYSCTHWSEKSSIPGLK